MGTFVWPSEDGWPYPDTGLEEVDHASDPDDDLLTVRLTDNHLFDRLDPLERTVITRRFGLDGAPSCSMRQLQSELGVGRADLRVAMGTGLAKLRTELRG